MSTLIYRYTSAASALLCSWIEKLMNSACCVVESIDSHSKTRQNASTCIASQDSEKSNYMTSKWGRNGRGSSSAGHPLKHVGERKFACLLSSVFRRILVPDDVLGARTKKGRKQKLPLSRIQAKRELPITYCSRFRLISVSHDWRQVLKFSLKLSSWSFWNHLSVLRSCCAYGTLIFVIIYTFFEVLP